MNDSNATTVTSTSENTTGVPHITLFKTYESKAVSAATNEFDSLVSHNRNWFMSVVSNKYTWSVVALVVVAVGYHYFR